MPTEGLISIIDDDEDFREAIVLSENSIRLRIRVARQNHRMIGADARSPVLARHVHRRLVQVAVPA